MPTKFVYFQPTKISKSVIHIWVYKPCPVQLKFISIPILKAAKRSQMEKIFSFSISSTFVGCFFHRIKSYHTHLDIRTIVENVGKWLRTLCQTLHPFVAIFNQWL